MKVTKSTPKKAVKGAKMLKRIQAPTKATTSPQKKKRKISAVDRAAIAAGAKARWARFRAAKAAALKKKVKK